VPVAQGGPGKGQTAPRPREWRYLWQRMWSSGRNTVYALDGGQKRPADQAKLTCAHNGLSDIHQPCAQFDGFRPKIGPVSDGFGVAGKAGKKGGKKIFFFLRGVVEAAPDRSAAVRGIRLRSGSSHNPPRIARTRSQVMRTILATIN